jgi:hypothetical protein
MTRRTRSSLGVAAIDLDVDRATGKTYTVAHHLFAEDGNRKISDPGTDLLTLAAATTSAGRA